MAETNLIKAADQDLFGFAGLWDGSVAQHGTTIQSSTMRVMQANPMSEIHYAKQRMPTHTLDRGLGGVAPQAHRTSTCNSKAISR